MSTSIAKPRNEGMVTIDKYLQKAKGAIAARLGEVFSADELITLVHSSIRQTPQLAECDPLTVVGSVYTAAEAGLRIGSTFGEAYLVPFRNRKRGGVRECQLIVGYRGMLKMVYQAGALVSHTSAVVYERDGWDYHDGFELRLVHRPYEGRDRGKPRCVYAVLRLSTGGAVARVMPWWQIEDLQERASDGSAWKSDIGPMAEKTAIRRGCKGIPMSPRASRMMQLDAQSERGRGQTGMRVLAAEVLEQALPPADAVDDLTEDFVGGDDEAADDHRDLEVLNDPNDKDAP